MFLPIRCSHCVITGYCQSGNNWPNSKLGTNQVRIMAVCEIVNRPEEFRAEPDVKNKFDGQAGPHYVVQHVGTSALVAFSAGVRVL
jgi:hypothetical protein